MIWVCYKYNILCRLRPVINSIQTFLGNYSVAVKGGSVFCQIQLCNFVLAFKLLSNCKAKFRLGSVYRLLNPIMIMGKIIFYQAFLARLNFVDIAQGLVSSALVRAKEYRCSVVACHNCLFFPFSFNTYFCAVH